MVPVLQGAFLVTEKRLEWGEGLRSVTTHEWRDLETQDEPYIEDHIPFFTPDEQSDARQAVCDALADQERADECSAIGQIGADAEDCCYAVFSSGDDDQEQVDG